MSASATIPSEGSSEPSPPAAATAAVAGGKDVSQEHSKEMKATKIKNSNTNDKPIEVVSTTTTTTEVPSSSEQQVGGESKKGDDGDDDGSPKDTEGAAPTGETEDVQEASVVKRTKRGRRGGGASRRAGVVVTASGDATSPPLNTSGNATPSSQALQGNAATKRGKGNTNANSTTEGSNVNSVSQTVVIRRSKVSAGISLADMRALRNGGAHAMGLKRYHPEGYAANGSAPYENQVHIDGENDNDEDEAIEQLTRLMLLRCHKVQEPMEEVEKKKAKEGNSNQHAKNNSSGKNAKKASNASSLSENGSTQEPAAASVGGGALATEPTTRDQEMYLRHLRRFTQTDSERTKFMGDLIRMIEHKKGGNNTNKAAGADMQPNNYGSEFYPPYAGGYGYEGGDWNYGGPAGWMPPPPLPPHWDPSMMPMLPPHMYNGYYPPPAPWMMGEEGMYDPNQGMPPFPTAEHFSAMYYQPADPQYMQPASSPAPPLPGQSGPVEGAPSNEPAPPTAAAAVAAPMAAAAAGPTKKSKETTAKDAVPATSAKSNGEAKSSAAAPAADANEKQVDGKQQSKKKKKNKSKGENGQNAEEKKKDKEGTDQTDSTADEQRRIRSDPSGATPAPVSSTSASGNQKEQSAPVKGAVTESAASNTTTTSTTTATSGGGGGMPLTLHFPPRGALDANTRVSTFQPQQPSGNMPQTVFVNKPSEKLKDNLLWYRNFSGEPGAAKELPTGDDGEAQEAHPQEAAATTTTITNAAVPENDEDEEYVTPRSTPLLQPHSAPFISVTPQERAILGSIQRDFATRMRQSMAAAAAAALAAFSGSSKTTTTTTTEDEKLHEEEEESHTLPAAESSAVAGEKPISSNTQEQTKAGEHGTDAKDGLAGTANGSSIPWKRHAASSVDRSAFGSALSAGTNVNKTYFYYHQDSADKEQEEKGSHSADNTSNKNATSSTTIPAKMAKRKSAGAAEVSGGGGGERTNEVKVVKRTGPSARRYAKAVEEAESPANEATQTPAQPSKVKTATASSSSAPVKKEGSRNGNTAATTKTTNAANATPTPTPNSSAPQKKKEESRETAPQPQPPTPSTSTASHALNSEAKPFVPGQSYFTGPTPGSNGTGSGEQGSGAPATATAIPAGANGQFFTPNVQAYEQWKMWMEDYWCGMPANPQDPLHRMQPAGRGYAMPSQRPGAPAMAMKSTTITPTEEPVAISVGHDANLGVRTVPSTTKATAKTTTTATTTSTESPVTEEKRTQSKKKAAAKPKA